MSSNGYEGGSDVSVPTRERILSLLDDIELISKYVRQNLSHCVRFFFLVLVRTNISLRFFSRELIENSVQPKPKKMSGADHDSLTQLLVDKDKQLKETMAVRYFLVSNKMF